MCKKLIYLIPFVFVLGSVSNAEDIQWTDLGADHLWSTPENWDLGRVPTLDDEVRIDVPAAAAPNGPVIQDGIDAKAKGIFNEAPGEPTLTMTGGTLEVAEWIWYGDGADSFGIWDMSGGTVTVANEFELGWDGGAGTLTMTGGTINAGEAVIPTGSGAFGELFLNGGTYNVTKPGGLNVKENGLVDITEGTLVLEGDETAKINDLVAAGLITAYGGDGKFELDFDVRNPGKTTVTAIPAPEPVNPGTEGLVAQYAMENDANDSSGNELHGTIIGDPVFVEGVAGMALEFDGVDDRVAIADDATFDAMSEKFTITAWIKLSAEGTTGRRPILSKELEPNPDGRGWEFKVNNGQLAMQLYSPVEGEGKLTVAGSASLEADQWYHVVGIYQADGPERFYINGVLDHEQELVTALQANASPANIGAYIWSPTGYQAYFAGLIDEVRAYSRVLSEPEVRYLAGKRATPVDPGTDGLVAFYPLENDVNDSSGNELHGTIVGNPTFVEGPAGYGMAMEFHGLGAAGGGGDYIDCGNDASLDITGPISMALWIRPGADDPEGQGTETAPMAKAMDGVGWSWQVRYGWGSPQPYMAFTFNSSPRAWAYVGRNLERDEWCHIACSHDGTTLKCYLNGEQTDSTPMGQITSSEAPVLIGSDGWGCDWIGAIDEVAIYNRDLSGGEVRYLAGYRAPVDPGNEGLVAHWPLDKGAGNTAADIVGGHDGTLKGGVAWAGEGSPVNGDALYFDGSTPGAQETDPGNINWVDVGTMDVTGGTGLTLAAWIRPEGFGIGDARIINKAKNWWPDIMWMLSTYDPDGTGLRFRVMTEGQASPTTLVSDSVYLEAGVWSHAAATYDIATAKMKIYHNGEVIAEADHGVGGPVATDPTITASIGNSGPGLPGGLSHTFHGLIDEVRAYSRVLSEPEVRYLAGDE